MKKPEKAGLTCHSTRLELQAHLTSFVLLATVHSTNIRALPALELLKLWFGSGLLSNSGNFAASLRLCLHWFGQSNLYRAWVLSTSLLTVYGRYPACILNEWNPFKFVRVKCKTIKFIGYNQSNKWLRKCMHSHNVLWLQWDSKITKMQVDKT